MPLTYRIIPEKKLVLVKGEGPVTFDDLLEHLERLASDPDYVPPMKKLVDHRKSHQMALTVAEHHIFTQRKRALLPRFEGERCAIVVTHDVDFGMARMLELYLGERCIRGVSIFRRGVGSGRQQRGRVCQ